MNDKRAPSLSGIEALLRTVFDVLAKTVDEKQARAMLNQASEAAWNRPSAIPKICLVHGRNPDCSCDEPKNMVGPLELLDGGAEQSTVSTASLRILSSK